CVLLRKQIELVRTRDPTPECSLDSECATSEADIPSSHTGMPPQSTSRQCQTQPPAPNTEVVIPEVLKIELRERSTVKDPVISSASTEDNSTPSSIPDEVQSSKASTSSSNSLDLFDEKSRDGAKKDTVITLDLTPLRSCSRSRRSSAARFSLNDGIINLSPEEDPVSKPEEVVDGRESAPCVPRAPTLKQNLRRSGIRRYPMDPTSRNEYFEYHDPFMEPWYDPVEMNDQSPSQSASKPAKDDAEKSPLDKAGRRRSSRIYKAAASGL
ncbi:hypothetical protein OSTOST_24577, partial [Ostertagia ostertagi]